MGSRQEIGNEAARAEFTLIAATLSVGLKGSSGWPPDRLVQIPVDCIPFSLKKELRKSSLRLGAAISSAKTGVATMRLPCRNAASKRRFNRRTEIRSHHARVPR
jgi:hypothetical protein